MAARVLGAPAPNEVTASMGRDIRLVGVIGSVGLTVSIDIADGLAGMTISVGRTDSLDQFAAMGVAGGAG